MTEESVSIKQEMQVHRIIALELSRIVADQAFVWLDYGFLSTWRAEVNHIAGAPSDQWTPPVTLEAWWEDDPEGERDWQDFCQVSELSAAVDMEYRYSHHSHRDLFALYAYQTPAGEWKRFFLIGVASVEEYDDAIQRLLEWRGKLRRGRDIPALMCLFTYSKVAWENILWDRIRSNVNGMPPAETHFLNLYCDQKPYMDTERGRLNQSIRAILPL